MTKEQLDLVEGLIAAGVIEKRFNLSFITGADASDARPEAAGMGVAMMGSFFMMMVVLVLALPIGVAASIYLSGRICAKELDHRYHRGEYFELGRGAIYYFRYLETSGVHQLHALAPIGTAGGWLGVDASDTADDHYFDPRIA